MNVIERFKLMRLKGFLKKHGCTTQEEYDRKYDPDIYQFADRLKDYYKGYPTYRMFTTTQEYPFNGYSDWTEGMRNIKEWCNQNCQGKWRDDFHRVLRQTGIGLDGDMTEEWFFNELGGRDALVFAFKDPKDYTFFTLRWG